MSSMTTDLHDNAVLVLVFGSLSTEILSLASMENRTWATWLMHRLSLRTAESLGGTFISKLGSTFII